MILLFLVYFILAILIVLVITYFIYKNKIQFNFSINIQSDLKDKDTEFAKNKECSGSKKDGKIDSQEMKDVEENWKFCFDSLKNVSRSFNIVIRQLDDETMNVVCIFYLVLRGLDTIEDDMSIPIEDKKQILLNFHNDIENDDYSVEYGDKPEYRILMKNFYKVNRSYKQLHSKYRDVIKNITNEMAKGMVEFLDKSSIDTITEYDSYCHYVAGLVGIGLSQIFTLSGLEFNDLTKYDKLSNSMGLFLQKTNIIRDIKEDYDEKRYWWPKDIISRHFVSIHHIFGNENVDGEQDIEKINQENIITEKHTHLLNEMIVNALQHIPDSIEYLSLVKNNSNFKFCAIPQVVAVQTLATLFNNQNVFNKTEKLNKTTLAKIFMDVSDMNSVLQFYIDAVEKIENKISDINSSNSKNYCNELDKIKAFIMKYIIEHSKKPVTSISLTKVKKSVISTFISLFQKNVLYPLSNM
jgi:farnesyl-diphosphate farnesyltransferase